MKASSDCAIFFYQHKVALANFFFFFSLALITRENIASAPHKNCAPNLKTLNSRPLNSASSTKKDWSNGNDGVVNWRLEIHYFFFAVAVRSS